MRYRVTGSVAFIALAKQMVRSAGLMLLVPAAGVYVTGWALLHPGGEVGAGSGLLMVGLGVVFFLGMPLAQTRALMREPGFGGEMVLRITDAGMELKSGGVKSRVDWKGVRRVTEMREALVMHLKPAGFWIVPKGRLSAEDLEAMRALLQPHVRGNLRAGKKPRSTS